MARFTLAKRRPSENGWTEERLKRAQQIVDDFDPLTITHTEFCEELAKHHLSRIHSHYQ